MFCIFIFDDVPSYMMNLGKTTHLTLKNRPKEALAINCKLTYLTSIVVCTDRPPSVSSNEANSVFQFRRGEESMVKPISH